MISLLAEQVDYLHNLGTITLLSACDGSSSSSAAADKQTAAVVAALAADVEAYQLLQQLQQVQPPSNASSCYAAAPTPTAAAHAQHPISSSGRCTSHAEPLSFGQQQQQQQQDEPEDGGEGAVVTTQRLRAAVAPETVLQVSSAPLEQIVVELREITKRMALLRLAGSGAAAAAAAGEGSAVSGTLEDCVMEYGKLCMRVHMGKNQQSVQLSSINLETMCREQPPPGFWASIAECIQPSLTMEQVERLAFGFQVYLEKRAPLVSKSQEIVSQLQRRLGYSAAEDGGTTCPGASQHSQQQHHSSSNCRASAASNLAALNPEGLGFENHDVALQQNNPQPNDLLQQQQGGGGGGNSSSSSGDSLQCARQLEQLLLGDVSSPEQLDSLLQQLSVCTTQLWEVSRHLIFHWVNTLNTEQMAASITMSFPYWVQPVPLCEYVWRQQQEAYADGPCVSACSKV
uniref:Uncharacterized protein n=1 Tax=Tetradesmus obliquus TaxID=3088 RepID=A0A383VPD7_TETOB